jgi:hypothetical protein
MNAEMNPAGDQIRVIFTTHTVTIRGTGLRRLFGLLHRAELSFITTTSSPADNHDNQPVIREIEVGENPGAAMPGNQAA